MDTPRLKVLYVDDELSNLMVFEETYRRDFEIYTATSAKKGLEVLDNQYIDVIITDQKMPGMTGVEFLKVVIQKFPEIPPSRIMVSGYSLNSEIQEAFDKCKLYSFIEKPWNSEKFRNSIIESLLSKN